MVVICDVDARTLGKSAEQYPEAKTYSDWRRLLEQSDIDAVTISTPDHMHAPIAATAVQMGKHVYVQKPLAHTVYEAMKVTNLAAANEHLTKQYRAGGEVKALQRPSA